MLLRPKQTKFKKQHKGRISKIETRAIALRFGSFGLKTTQSGRITARQIEATRQTITRHIKRKGRLWIRIFPDTPISEKPTEVRMGKGKGNVSYWVAKVSAGKILFELDGIPEHLALNALRNGSTKLPVLTRIVKRAS